MRTFTRCFAAVGLAAALLFTAVPASASAEEDAGEAIEEYMTAAFAGDWATTYDMLPTAQSDLFSEADWEACQDRRNGRLVGAELEEFDVVDSKRKKYALPGTDKKVSALAVKIAITASLGGQTQSERDTVFVVKQGKSWRPSVRGPHVEDCLNG